MRKKLFPLLLCMSLGLLAGGCAGNKPEQSTSKPAVQAEVQSGTYAGVVAGVSERAQTLSISIGKKEDVNETMMMLKFDAKTKGMNQAAKGKPVKVKYEKRGADYYATEVELKLAQLPAGITEIKTDELKKLIDSKSSLYLVDSRPLGRFNQAHLPDAHSIPLPVLKKEKAAVLPKDKKQLLVFYCGGITCPLSPASAAIAKDLGYENVRVYHDGEPVWSKSNLPTYSTAKFIKEGNVVLIDIRPSKKAIKGRIKGTYSVPYELLEDKLDDVPRNAPLVLYGDKEVLDAVIDVRNEGFNYVSLVEGGYKGWVKSGGEIEKGPIYNTEIKWVRKLGKGEVSVADFRKAASGEDKDAIIVDARTKEEVAELGLFKNTINIPLDEIPARLQELPKDKKIYVHCSTGARADMAYNELIKHGYNAKFLLLNIKDAACDCEIIRP
ncbi:MAG: rhodanese-like domain-containing protein [Alphaproteobacteria bacterium]|nr:rhodanese-like domain-containing protein [Alphaproteobacteria bacterium]